MATAKKSTTTKKSTSTSTAPKKPRTPKPVVEKVDEPVTTEVEKIVVAEKKENKKARNFRVFIPLDPSETSEKQMIHGSENGRFYRLSRGEEHYVTEGLAEHLRDRVKGTKVLEEFVEANRYKGK